MPTLKSRSHTFVTAVLAGALLLACDAGPAAKKTDEKATKTDEKTTKTAEKSAPKPDEKANPEPAQPPAPAGDVLVTDVPEAWPGALIGYLKKEQMFDSLALVSPPPDKDSPGQAMDEAASKIAFGLKGTPRFEQATRDSTGDFPAAPDTFSCALGIQIGAEETPNLYRLMRRSWMDGMISGSTAKHHYKRVRPFTLHKEGTCSPEMEAEMLNDPSYPSGHTAMGWTWGLILTELAPDRQDPLLMRGYTYGLSRMICNAHWQTDVLTGRVLGAAVVARLHAESAFRADVVAARQDIAAARAKNLVPKRDCAAELAMLSAKHPGLF